MFARVLQFMKPFLAFLLPRGGGLMGYLFFSESPKPHKLEPEFVTADSKPPQITEPEPIDLDSKSQNSPKRKRRKTKAS